MEFPRMEIGGNCRYNWEHKGPPPQKEAPFQHLGLNRGFPQGWVGFSPLPFLPLRPEGVPLSPLVPGGRYYKAFVHYFRCKDTSHSGLIPIIHFHFHTSGPA